MIDVTVTATKRPKILERTLKSFRENLFGGISCTDLRLIINIDPVGLGVPVSDILEVAKKYFPFLIANFPKTPSFPKAFIWTWKATTSDYVMNLEDDWELVRPVNLAQMLECMEKYPNLASLRLPFRPIGDTLSKNWKFFYPWNGDYFECPRELQREVGFCGHPSLLRGEFVRRCVPFLDETKNPEKQFHHGARDLLKEVDKWKFGVFGKPNQPLAIVDIGRQWMKKAGFRKAGCKAVFTVWEKSEY